MGGVLLVGSLRRTRLPFPSRMFDILVCAMAAALKQNTKPAVRTAFVIALIPKFPESFRGSFENKKAPIHEIWLAFDSHVAIE
jgi:hypothetical protein